MIYRYASGPAGRWGGRPGPTWQEEVPERRERCAGLKPMFEKGAGDSGREAAAGTGDGDGDRVTCAMHLPGEGDSGRDRIVEGI